MRSAALAGVLASLALLVAPALAEDFHGYPCTQDCSGHEAGYDWAEQEGIADPDDCSGTSNSFVEGCQAWAEDQQDDSEASSGGDDDDGDDDGDGEW